MFGEVIDFLVDAKKSYREFDKLLQFYKFKDNIAHKQNFGDVCKEIKNINSPNIISYDFSKSYALNGRIFN